MSNYAQDYIEVRGARENNLQDVSLRIPKRKITVFTGVSGSGKSSLVFDTLAAESQRLVNETYTAFVQSMLPSHGRPDVDALDNLSAAIVIDQKRMGGNSRSTVGTVTDAYAMLRMVFARLGTPSVPHSGALSFNDRQGMCPVCEGLGDVVALDFDALLDADRSLNEGAIRFPTFAVGSWFWTIITESGFFDNDKKIRDYTAHERHCLLHSAETKLKLRNAAGSATSRYEGLEPKVRRLYLGKDPNQLQPHIRDAVRRVALRSACRSCGGSRLNHAALRCRINDVNIAECAAMEVTDLARFVARVDGPSVAPMLASLSTRLDGLKRLGLGYLSLGRSTSTLSGGESQRVKMIRHLGSGLSDIMYVFDEPSAGLHPHDVHLLNELLLQLRDKGNAVLVVEHEPAVIAIADHVVDMGPWAGRDGGRVVYEGTLAGLATSDTLTGRYLGRWHRLKDVVRSPTGALTVKDADANNLKNVTVDIPLGVLTVVTGVAGAGKSSLVREFQRDHPDALFIDHSPIRGSKRSTPATYTGLLDVVRKMFARENGVSAALFSANSKGACPRCQGLGRVSTDLVFMAPIVGICEACLGRRFTDDVLRYRLDGRTISEVLDMTVADALDFFGEKAAQLILRALMDVGLGYLALGRSLDTLSGGERQRLKLAAELSDTSGVYVLDEPTTGLHMHDVDRLIGLFDRLIDDGGTVLVIEHDLDVLARADWVIDLGPGAGRDGGEVVFAGTPAGLAADARSVTARHLRAHLGMDAADDPRSQPT
jgi:excinuclease UvrABC ATPase subunit